MKIGEAMRNIRQVNVLKNSATVFSAAARELAVICRAQVVEVDEAGSDCADGEFWITDRLDAVPAALREDPAPETGPNGNFLRLDDRGRGAIVAGKPNILFGFVSRLETDHGEELLESVSTGRFFPVTFSWQRVVFDFFLTQEGRVQRRFDKEEYVRSLAERGFTHIEVNGLAYPMGLETGPKGETYPMFYTYCPALDQFVSSELNKGIYADYYLSANLAFLKENAALAAKYGLTPGLLCFEPRSVPEEFFSRYPMLRGARVDHPFRSFKPRYNMTIAHPRVREHYAEMMGRLMEEVPELGFISIWTNDSGAGFEHINSLYVGRNGGPYLIREWKGAEEIARVAGENALRFLRVLRDAASAVNPEFRVLTRMEPFRDEHEVVWSGLGDRLDAEVATLTARGWEMPYSHVRYADSHAVIGGTLHQGSFDGGETELRRELEGREGLAHFYCSNGPWAIFAPLIGVPYPWGAASRLRMLQDHGVREIAQMGGASPPGLAPYDINHEVIGAIQFNADMEPDALVSERAVAWAGRELAYDLIEAWRLADEAVAAYPHITPLYSGLGFTWYRLWARPLVPDIEAIPERERAYYEDFMCTTPHNPNNVDLSRDVLFELAAVDGCRRDVLRMDDNVLPSINRAVELLNGRRADAVESLGERNVIEDQWVRLAALECWFTTQRNVGAWIVGVKGYMESDEADEKGRCREIVGQVIEGEIGNSRRLKELLDTGVDFMAMTDRGESPLIYGENLRDLVDMRIRLMRRHAEDEPYIDPEYIERQAGKAIS